MWAIDKFRLAAAMDRAGMNQSQLAQAVGLKQPSIARLLSGETQTSRAIDKIAAALSTSAAYLKGETDRPEAPEDVAPESFEVPLLCLGQLAGAADLAQLRDLAPTIPLPRVWLESFAAGSPRDLVAMRAEGDQMMPTLLAGDMMLVDAGQVQLVEQDRLFCVALSGLAMIRRIRMIGPGLVRLMADNPAISAIDVAIDSLDIAGRVVWMGRQI